MALLSLVPALSGIWAVTFGPVAIDPGQVADILGARLFNPESAWARELLDTPRADIILNIRLPRVVMGALVGAGLALSGVVMQSVVRNPLANPYILGISSGASLGATAAILLGAFSFFGVYGICAGAFTGALLTSVFVFCIAFTGAGRGHTVKLLLAGMAVNAICSAFTAFIIYTAADAEGIRTVSFWTMGGLTNASWRLVPVPLVSVGLILAFFLTQFRILNVMLLGEEAAVTMGIRLPFFRVGPNGSGKSTLLRAIYRVLAPSCGSIHFDGVAVNDIALKETARKLGVVAQSSRFGFDFTVKEMVMMGRTAHKGLMEADNSNDRAITVRAMEQAGVANFAERQFTTLSGGEQQRVLIARALASTPRALVMDEPTNHLDIRYQLGLMETVKQLKIAIFSAMHDLNIAAAYCDRIYVMDRGMIAASGSPEQVFTPDLLKAVFKVDVQVIAHDRTGRPVIIFNGI